MTIDASSTRYEQTITVPEGTFVITQVHPGEYIAHFTWTRSSDAARITSWTPGARQYPHALTVTLLQLLRWVVAKLEMIDVSKPGQLPIVDTDE